MHSSRFALVLFAACLWTVNSTEVATFAAGCFWSVENAFQRVFGVTATEVGYTGGKQPYATYEQVGAGETGHAEAVKVQFDQSKVSYADLLGTPHSSILHLVHQPR